MFKGIAVKEKVCLGDYLPIKAGQIISQNLVMNNRCDIRLFSFDSSEEVGIQTSKADILYWVLEGEGIIQIETGKISLNAGEVIVMGKGTPHGIQAKTSIKVFQISLYEKETDMDKFIKNIEHGKAFKMDEILEYETGKVASMTIAQNDKLSVTLMSFDKGEGISTHAAGGDAMVQVLDGTVEITIDKDVYVLDKGETIVMPANIPHSLKAVEQFKMFLIVVKP
jgi:quercetin dioxygenase-like cupin family protein